MAFLFRRTAEVQIIKQQLVTGPIEGFVAGETTSEIKTIKNLRIQFKIQKGASSTLNNSTINIFNLNRDTRGFIEGADNTAILRAGYQDISGNRILNNIFSGNISRIEHKRTGSNIISKLHVIDSQKDVVATHVEENFAPGSKTEQILRVVLNKFGLNNDSINKLINSVKSRGISTLSQEYVNGLSLTGNFKEVMEKLLNRENIDFSMQDGNVLIDSDDVVETEAVVINKNTGMIGIPVKKEEGIEVISLIQPGLSIGNTIKIESELIDGFFKVRQLIYEGDTHQNKWQIKAIAK